MPESKTTMSIYNGKQTEKKRNGKIKLEKVKKNYYENEVSVSEEENVVERGSLIKSPALFLMLTFSPG